MADPTLYNQYLQQAIDNVYRAIACCTHPGNTQTLVDIVIDLEGMKEVDE